PLADAKLEPVLAVHVVDSKVTGFATLKSVARLHDGLADAITHHGDKLGWIGLDLSGKPKLQNEISGGTLVFQLTGVSFAIGGVVNGTLSFGFTGAAVTFDAAGNIK